MMKISFNNGCSEKHNLGFNDMLQFMRDNADYFIACGDGAAIVMQDLEKDKCYFLTCRFVTQYTPLKEMLMHDDMYAYEYPSEF